MDKPRAERLRIALAMSIDVFIAMEPDTTVGDVMSAFEAIKLGLSKAVAKKHSANKLPPRKGTLK